MGRVAFDVGGALLLEMFVVTLMDRVVLEGVVLEKSDSWAKTRIEQNKMNPTWISARKMVWEAKCFISLIGGG